MNENMFLLSDRKEKIKSMAKIYDFEKNAYISFSGGKDSCILSKLFDLALPGNNIPRIFFNTGLEYPQIRQFIAHLSCKDKRIVVINSNQNVKEIWEKWGYPMKSKQHSHILHIYQNSGKTLSVKKYLREVSGNNKLYCSKKFLYQFSENFHLKVSDMCCTKMKKQVAHRFEKESGRYIAITGMRKSEGGQRLKLSGCTTYTKEFTLKKFSPLAIISDEWCEWFVDNYFIELCKLYKPPFNFKRTGCIGCPFALNIGEELAALKKYDEKTYRFAETLWGEVYNEYEKICYRNLEKVRALEA